MVLDHVADCSGLIIETAAALHPEVLCHLDLDALDEIAVPKGLHESVGKPERQDIVDCSLTQVMINAKDVSFVKGAKQNLVQFLRRSEVMPEGLFHDDSGAAPAV